MTAKLWSLKDRGPNGLLIVDEDDRSIAGEGADATPKEMQLAVSAPEMFNAMQEYLHSAPGWARARAREKMGEIVSRLIKIS